MGLGVVGQGLRELTLGHIFLSDEDVTGLGIEPPEVANAVEAALIAKSEGRLHTTPKSSIMPGDGRYMMSTLAVGDDGLTVLKAVGVYPENAGRDLPAITGAIMVLDAETGRLRAVMDANWVTAVRTAALSVVAARRMADPKAKSAAFVGCGVQASSHLAAFNAMFPLEKIYVIGRGGANVDRLCGEARDMGLTAEQTTPDVALPLADLIVTSITLDYSIKPFLDANLLKPGAFAAVTDLFIPWKDTSATAFGGIVVDDLEQERAAEKPMVSADLIKDDLTGIVVNSEFSVPQDRPNAFIFRGLALGDYAAAALALKVAEKAGAGQRIG